MRITIAVLCLFFGLVFPSLLNGQTFTNSVLGIAFATAAVALAIGPARNRNVSGYRLGASRVVLGLGVLLAAFLVAQLPSAYRFQTGFNHKIQELRRAGAP
jgi:hypothetical protein